MQYPSDRILERLLSLHPKLIDLSLDRMTRLLADLGNPEQKMPPQIHVAGTNGKGSTVAFLRAFLEAAGYRVHAYTSPHLVRFHERIRIAGKLVSEPELAKLLEECETANAGQPMTFFEITTAAAFLAFSRVPADVALIEVGLGGRFDATNVLEKPAATVITPVSLDHQHFLGETVSAIAFEKAGILKPGAPAVIGPQLRDAELVIEKRAREVVAPFFRAGKEWSVTHEEGGGLLYRGKATHQLPAPGLPGDHQYDNAGAALAALEQAGFTIGTADLARGMGEVEWPARLQKLTRGPLIDALPQGCALWLDGAHNQAGGEALARFIAGWPEKPDVIFGMLNTHDAAAFLKPMAPHINKLAAIAIPGEANTLSADEAAAAARQARIDASAQPDALTAVKAVARKSGRVLICGSLYLAGRILAENG